MVTTGAVVPARHGVTDRLAWTICKIGIAARWDVAVVWRLR